MPRIDWPLEECRSYKPELWRQPDFEVFWMVRCPTLMSIGMWDDICLPSTCFAAFNHLGGEKEAAVYSYLGHEHPT